jgi:hypothetical protein
MLQIGADIQPRDPMSGSARDRVVLMDKRRAGRKLQAGGQLAGRPAQSTKRLIRPAKRVKPAGYKRSARASNKRPGDAAATLFPGMSLATSRFGLGVLFAVAKKEGGDGVVELLRMERFSGKPGGKPRSSILSRVDPKAAAGLITGLAHPNRFRIAAAIMTGADSHQKLAGEVRLKAGPLYHHLRSLERSGVVTCPGRSKYVLTDRGQMAVFMLVGLSLREKSGAGWIRLRPATKR